MVIDMSDEEYPYVCIYCSRPPKTLMFKSNAMLEKHINEKHPDIRERKRIRDEIRYDKIGEMKNKDGGFWGNFKDGRR